jgi:hypothetical protein
MLLFLRVCLTASLFLMWATGFVPAEQSGLLFPLRVRSTQTGIAGETGTEWRIETDGRWTAYRVQSEQPDVLIGSGVLGVQDTVDLVGILQRYNISDLPTTLGQVRGTNPQRLMIRIGDKSTVLYGKGGDDLMGADDASSSMENRVRELAREVRTLTTK